MKLNCWSRSRWLAVAFIITYVTCGPVTNTKAQLNRIFRLQHQMLGNSVNFKKGGTKDNKDIIRWRPKNIPIVFSVMLHHNWRIAVRIAAREIHRSTHGCVTFNIYPAGHRILRRRVHILVEHEKDANATSGCSGKAGMGYPGVPYRQGHVYLNGWNSCSINGMQGVVQHELLHSLGFSHEQQRPDRDMFVFINKSAVASENIDTFDTNYGKHEHQPTFGLPYDYDSIMHYGHSDVLRCARNNPLCDDATMQFRRGDGMTKYDVAKVQSLYCPQKLDNTIVLQDYAFIVSHSDCRDVELSMTCAKLADRCGIDPYLDLFCRKTCKTC